MSTLTTARLTATTARWADRHHGHHLTHLRPARIALNIYQQRADTLYWARRPDTVRQARRQFARMEAIREPLARAARALARETGHCREAAHDLTHLWDTPGMMTVLAGGTVMYEIARAAHTVMECIPELLAAAEAHHHPAWVLCEHLDRPG